MIDKIPLEVQEQIFSLLGERDVTSVRAVCKNTQAVIGETRYAIVFSSLWGAKYDMPKRLSGTKKNTIFPKRRAIEKKEVSFLDFLPKADKEEEFKKEEYKDDEDKEQKAINFTLVLVNDSLSTLTHWQEGLARGDIHPDSKQITESAIVMPTTNNAEALERYILKKTDLFDYYMFPSEEPAMGKINKDNHTSIQTLQVAFAHMLFRSTGISSVDTIARWPDSQRWAYESIRLAPVFFGNNNQCVNVTWISHLINFFRAHFLRPNNSTTPMTRTYDALPARDKIRGFLSGSDALSDPQKRLGRCWYGTYAYLSRGEVHSIRQAGRNGEKPKYYADRRIDEERSMQTIDFEFPEPGEEKEWPKLFEHWLRSVPLSSYDDLVEAAGAVAAPVQPAHAPAAAPPAHLPARPQHQSASTSTRILKNYIGLVGDSKNVQTFSATGFDQYDKYEALGRLNDLPPQHGVPGWRRFTMMKFYRHQSDNSMDTTALYAYEGVVLPGSQLIIGRWWSAENLRSTFQYSGPFIFWAAGQPWPNKGVVATTHPSQRPDEYFVPGVHECLSRPAEHHKKKACADAGHICGDSQYEMHKPKDMELTIELGRNGHKKVILEPKDLSMPEDPSEPSEFPFACKALVPETPGEPSKRKYTPAPLPPPPISRQQIEKDIERAKEVAKKQREETEAMEYKARRMLEVEEAAKEASTSSA